MVKTLLTFVLIATTIVLILLSVIIRNLIKDIALLQKHQSTLEEKMNISFKASENANDSIDALYSYLNEQSLTKDTYYHNVNAMRHYYNYLVKHHKRLQRFTYTKVNELFNRYYRLEKQMNSPWVGTEIPDSQTLEETNNGENE